MGQLGQPGRGDRYLMLVGHHDILPPAHKVSALVSHCHHFLFCKITVTREVASLARNKGRRGPHEV